MVKPRHWSKCVHYISSYHQVILKSYVVSMALANCIARPMAFISLLYCRYLHSFGVATIVHCLRVHRICFHPNNRWWTVAPVQVHHGQYIGGSLNTVLACVCICYSPCMCFSRESITTISIHSLIRVKWQKRFCILRVCLTERDQRFYISLDVACHLLPVLSGFCRDSMVTD